MSSVDRWTGHLTLMLRRAFRDSQEDFAARLGIAARTVARWSEQPEMVPRPQLQRVLDHALSTASAEIHARFDEFVRPAHPATLGVAIAIVLNEQRVLLVRRRESDAAAWQFPAGVVKPESSPAVIAVRETFAETGIDCRVIGSVGARVHPRTGVHATYLACEYLTGEPANRDPLENDSVTWALCRDITRFIPAEQIFPPVLALIQENQ